MSVYISALIAFALGIVVASIRQINQYERGVKFTFGKFTGEMRPGWRLVWPIIQSYRRVDIRVKAVDVPDQNAITRDNDISSDQSNTVVFTVPLEILKAFVGFGKKS